MDISLIMNNLQEDFHRLFGEDPIEEINIVPTTVKLLGNFTRHSGGKELILPVSALNICLASSGVQSVVSYSLDGKSKTILDIASLDGKTEEFHTVSGLIRGILAKILIDKNMIIPGMFLLLNIEEDVINESVATLVMNSINNLFFDGKLTKDEMEVYIKYSLEYYVGVKFSKVKYDALYFKSLTEVSYAKEMTYILRPLSFYPYAILKLRSANRFMSGYSIGDSIDKSMDEVANKLGKTKLGELSHEEWFKSPLVTTGGIEYTKAMIGQYYFDELTRISQIENASYRNDVSPLVNSMKLSAFFSETYLRCAIRDTYLYPALYYLNNSLRLSGAFLSFDTVKGEIIALIHESELNAALEYLNTYYPKELITTFNVNDTGPITVLHNFSKTKDAK